MPLRPEYPLPHLSEGPTLVATNIFFSQGPVTAHYESEGGKAWRSSPSLELVHSAVNGDGGTEIGSLVPQCISFGFVPHDLGFKGNSFSRLMTTTPGSSPDTWDMPLVEEMQLETLYNPVRSVKLEDDVRPLLQGLANTAGWSSRQSASMVETMTQLEIEHHPGSSVIQGTDNRRTIFATTGKMIHLSSRVIGDERQTIHTFIVPGAICEIDESKHLGNAETTMRPGAERYDWVYQHASGKDAGLPCRLNGAAEHALEVFGSRFDAQMAKLQMDSLDLNKTGWTLRDFRHRLREYEENIKTAATRACDEMPGWYGKVSEVSALPFSSPDS